MKKLFKTLAVLIVLFVMQNVYAQQIPVSGSIDAKGTVIQHITITGSRDLDFGEDIVPGVEKSIDKTALNSGMFALSGKANREISVSFTLPTVLSSGNNSMPINFLATDGGYQTNGPAIITFNPSFVTNVVFSTNGIMKIFLGGTIYPSVSQTSGFYSAPISINLEYTTD